MQFPWRDYMSGNYRQTSALSTDCQWISAEPSGVEFQSQKGAALLIGLLPCTVPSDDLSPSPEFTIASDGSTQ